MQLDMGAEKMSGNISHRYLTIYATGISVHVNIFIDTLGLGVARLLFTFINFNPISQRCHSF